MNEAHLRSKCALESLKMRSFALKTVKFGIRILALKYSAINRILSANDVRTNKKHMQTHLNARNMINLR